MAEKLHNEPDAGSLSPQEKELVDKTFLFEELDGEGQKLQEKVDAVGGLDNADEALLSRIRNLHDSIANYPAIKAQKVPLMKRWSSLFEKIPKEFLRIDLM